MTLFKKWFKKEVRPSFGQCDECHRWVESPSYVKHYTASRYTVRQLCPECAVKAIKDFGVPEEDLK